VWHEATRALQDEGRITMAGIVEEQHGERARLFMQWKEMDWPVMVDAFNLLEVPHVPITLLIDEQGVVREIVSPRADPLKTVEAFLEKSFTLSEYEVPEEEDPDEDMVQFRLGVKSRMRFDAEEGTPEDFRKAVEHWEKALAIDPNNYIHRRRIQQYGPRLDKPYPFYDWVDEARRDIRERGETPVALPVEPRGAELAGPVKTFAVSNTQKKSPGHMIDITRDDAMVEIETALVPSHAEPGGSVRVHLFFNPAEGIHWNNEAGNMVVWASAPEGWSLSNPHLIYPVPADRAVSRERRSLEFEVLVSGQGDELEAYALYYVCEEEGGACLFRRQDLKIPIPIRK
jgi:hypothetical protein